MNPVTPWELEDAFPVKPAGSEYGHERRRQLIPCSYSEFLERGPRARLVWTPESDRLIPPGEVSFLRPRLKRMAIARLRDRVGYLILSIVLFGGLGALGPSRERPFYIAVAVLAGVLPLVRTVRTRRVLEAAPPDWIPGTPMERRFLAWIRRRPAGFVWALTGTLAAVFVWQLIVGLNPSIFAAGLVAPLVREGEPWRLMTCTLIHASFIHVALNLMALAAIGWMVEALAGRWRMAIAWLASALGGSLCSYLMSPSGISVGASGGIVGLLGFLAVLVAPRFRGYPRGLRRWVFGAVALVFLTGAVAYQFIDNAGHAGGFVAGVLVGMLLLRSRSTVPAPAGPALKTAGALCLALVMGSAAAMGILIREETTGLTGLFDQAYARLDRNDYEGAVRGFDRFIELQPNYFPAWWSRGVAQSRLQRFEAAERDYTEAIRLAPNEGQVYADRGSARWRLGRLEEARRDMDEGVRRAPDHIHGRMNRAALLWERQDLEGALADYDAVLKIDPRHAQARHWRGTLRLNQGDLDGALEDLNQELEIDPKSADNHVQRAWVQYLRKEYDLALADCERALALKPGDAYAINTRGLARGGKGEVDAAIADFSEAIRLDPKHKYAYPNRGDARREKGDLAGALADYEEALKLNAKDGDALWGRGLVRRHQGDLQGARADIEAALKAADPWWRSRAEAESALKELR